VSANAVHELVLRTRIKARRVALWRFIQGVSRELTVQSLYNTAGGSIVCPDAFPFALTRLFFQALNQPIKIHVCPGLCAGGDAAVSNFKEKQFATRDLLRRLQQQGGLMGQAAGSAAPSAGWPQFGTLTGIEGVAASLKFGCKQYTQPMHNIQQCLASKVKQVSRWQQLASGTEAFVRGVLQRSAAQRAAAAHA
jgi:hypothetical protein